MASSQVKQIAVGPGGTGTLYLLDSKGCVWQSKAGLVGGFEKVALPQAIDPDWQPKK